MMTDDMLQASLIKEINKKVKEPWTKKDLTEGKKIVVMWEDIEIVKNVIPKFVEKGWVIKKKQALLEASGRKIILHITKPPFDDFKKMY